MGGSVAEWLACWTQVQKGPGSNRSASEMTYIVSSGALNSTPTNPTKVHIAAAMLSGNSVRQTVLTHRASVHQAAKLVAALIRAAGVTAGLAESNGSLPPGL